MNVFLRCGALLLLVMTWMLVTGQGDASGSDPQDEKVEVKEVLTGLVNPMGLVASPEEPDSIYVAESGAGKILRVKVNGSKREEVVTGFKLDNYGKGPTYKVGPLGLALLNLDMLVVGDGSLPDGQELVRIYTIPEAGKTLPVDDCRYKLGPIAAGEASRSGEGNFYGVAVGNTAIYVTCKGDDTKGWIARAELKDGQPGELKPFISTKTLSGVDAPTAITLNRRGQIVVGQMGTTDRPKDSLLTFYSPKTGKLLLKLETGLHDIVGLAYSPQTGRLYAIDFAGVAEEDGGLYRLDRTLDQGAMGVKAVKICSLKKPTSLAFGLDGERTVLYVTELGAGSDGGQAKTGRLLKIVGNL